MTTTQFTFRETNSDDQHFLAAMLVEAAKASGADLAVEDLPALPGTHRYISGWGRPTDLGVIAHDESGIAAGAAWVRLFDAKTASPAFIDERTPELTIAITSAVRGRGLGSSLLQRLHAAATHAGLPGLSLGVHRDNHPAQRLYRTNGWVRHATVGDYEIMHKSLD
ncbi:GNAT family N-acetyltransferase [Nocardia inohanensis]|uniref:GNAT family N-acetyltransferase n=1 Tax=Nocardia inohanensis TaxID=209246 RepID=UPI0009FEAF82|nr:GNAT family N-acetyltransferase [Nocardia inohanensis]